MYELKEEMDGRVCQLVDTDGVSEDKPSLHGLK
jgi:hypothetical protein